MSQMVRGGRRKARIVAPARRMQFCVMEPATPFEPFAKSKGFILDRMSGGT
jgi:hypothetical protein